MDVLISAPRRPRGHSVSRRCASFGKSGEVEVATATRGNGGCPLVVPLVSGVIVVMAGFVFGRAVSFCRLAYFGIMARGGGAMAKGEA